jgi:D-alanyl-D-alanine carboxypeptidase/D-alanyl-D-alanine-endopeptidase (penicillin-binding protein 4)
LSSTWGRVFVSLSFVLFTGIAAGTASAAPTADAALERYRSAVARAGLDADRQGVYVETLSGKELLAHNAESHYNPASVVKIATSDVALRNLGPDFRYGTRFFADGEVDRKAEELRGDLVVVGSGDPSLTTEHAAVIAAALRRDGVARVTGDLVVTGPLVMNFAGDRAAAGAAFKRVFGARGVEVDGKVAVRPEAPTGGMTLLFTHRSAPLVDILKAQNNYSNNFMAHEVGARVGGAGGVERSMEDRYGFAPGDVRLETTSGLGENAMRPRDVVALLRGVAGAYEPSRLMPVAGVDAGTLDDRFGEPGMRGAVVAKTGTLSSVSVLAGYMYTRREGVVLFAIMNEGGSPGAFRPLQDLLVRELFEAYGGPAPISYRPTWRGAFAGSIVPPERAAAPARASRRPSLPTSWTRPAPWRSNVLPFLVQGRTAWPAWLDPGTVLDPQRRGLVLLDRYVG